jgi:hypothetical protein
VQKLHQTVDDEGRLELLRVYGEYAFPNTATVRLASWARVFVDLILPPLVAIVTIVVLVTAAF